MITRTHRLLGLPLIAALIASVLVAPQAHAATTTVGTWDELSVAFAAGGHITVGANITGAGITASQSSPITLDLDGHDVTLTGDPAIRLEDGAHLTVKDTATGGLLTALGNGEPGGSAGYATRAAVIGSSGAGSGGSGHAGDLTIDGAIVHASYDRTESGGGGAVIGGGNNHDGGTVTVMSGELVADATHVHYAAAIGGGNRGAGGSLIVSGGSVHATGSGYGAAIGGGYYGDGGNVTVSAGTVYARNGNFNAAAIGGGVHGTGGELTMTGGSVTAISSRGGVAVGAGSIGTAPNTGTGEGPTVNFTAGRLEARSQHSTSIGGVKLFDTVSDPGAIILAGSLEAGSATQATGLNGAPIVTGSGSTMTRVTAGAEHGNGIYDNHTILESVTNVSFDAAGGSPTPAAVQVVGVDPVPTPHTPTRDGYDLTGWNVGNNAWDFSQAPTQDMTLTAQWKLREYDVTFNLNGGNGTITAQNVSHGSSATEPAAPTRAGHTFTGWKQGASLYDFTAAVTSDVALKADWDIHTYPITFNTHGGSDVAAQSVTYGSKVSQPKAPSRSGYIFRGWTHGGSQYDFNTSVTGPLTLTATWTKAANLIDVSGNKNSKHYTQFHSQIQWLANEGITKGWAVGGGKHEFRPKDEITREAMAAFMYRYAGSPAVKLPAKSPFSDVTPQNTNFYKEIVWMNQQGISTGWSVAGGKKEFRPKDEITRDAMAAFMYRFAGKPKTTPPASSPFVDVPKSSQFYKEVTWLSNAGISTGWTQPTGKPQYRPYDEISREAMAAFLYRLDRL